MEDRRTTGIAPPDTVAEWIALLQTMPADADVCFGAYSGVAEFQISVPDPDRPGYTKLILKMCQM